MCDGSGLPRQLCRRSAVGLSSRRASGPLVWAVPEWARRRADLIARRAIECLMSHTMTGSTLPANVTGFTSALIVPSLGGSDHDR